MAYQVHALPENSFQSLFALSDEALAEVQIVRKTVDAYPGYPCRISLSDANVGVEVLLVNFQHQPAFSPYQAAHAIYVSKNAKRAELPIDTLPAFLHIRDISLRAFDSAGMMVTAKLVYREADLDGAVREAFTRTEVDYIHLHFAAPGCYAACVTRAV